MKKLLLTSIQYVFFLFIGLLLFYLSFVNQNISAIINDFRHAEYRWIILALLTGLISHIIRAMRWNLLITPLGYKTKLSISFYAVMTGYMTNLAIPRAGEITRCGVISKQNKIPFHPVLGTVIVEIIFYLLCLLLILFFVIICQWQLLSTFMSEIFLDNIHLKLNNFMLIFFIILIFIAAFIFTYRFIIKPILIRFDIYLKMMNILKEFTAGIKSIRKIKSIKSFLFLSVLLWFFYTLSIYFCFFAITDTKSLSFHDALTVMAFGSIGVVLPVPGGVGTYHYIVKILLSKIFGIHSDAAFSFAAISHAAQILSILFLGSFSFVMLFFQSNTKLKNEKA